MAAIRKLPIGIQNFESLKKDGCIRFALLTGVTKFGKVSVFSDLNNLEDISMNRQYYDICGITEEEWLKLDGTAEEALEQISRKNYTLPFEVEGQKIIRIGINFDSKTHNIDKALVG